MDWEIISTIGTVLKVEKMLVEMSNFVEKIEKGNILKCSTRCAVGKVCKKK